MDPQEIPQGVILSVKVKPNSPSFRLTRKGDDYILEVTSPPREGKANQEILSELPRKARCEVSILRGSQAGRKLILLKGITAKEVEAFLSS